MDTMTGAILLLWTCRERACIVSVLYNILLIAGAGHASAYRGSGCLGRQIGCIISGSRVSRGRSLGGMIEPVCNAPTKEQKSLWYFD